MGPPRLMAGALGVAACAAYVQAGDLESDMRPRIAFLMAIAVLAGLASMGPALAMSGYKGKYRPVVVFAPEAGDQRLARQREIVEALKPAFIDRQVVLVLVGGDRVTVELGPPPAMGAEALRARYGIAPGEFKVLLVGKDGGVKLASDKPMAAQALFRAIDAMPMRVDEMRKK